MPNWKHESSREKYLWQFTPPPGQLVPSVSVIIPMFNAQRYISTCLDSLIAQTFQNFEVIVVDDCSTDNSAAIVQSYVERFGGRLKFTRTEKNSGTPGIPRNRGLLLSRGEYVFFMDSDDKFAVANAVEVMFNYAKHFNADIVHLTKNYEATADGQIMCMGDNKALSPDGKIIIEENLPLRVQRVIDGNFGYASWRYFIRRDLMLENDLFFPEVVAGEDQIFIRCLLFRSKRLLLMPFAAYIYQCSPNSICRSQKNFDKWMKHKLESVISGVSILEKNMNKIEYFRLNPKRVYDVLEQFISQQFGSFLQIFEKCSSNDIYDGIKRVFNCRLGEHAVLISALFTLLNTQKKINHVNKQEFQQSTAQAQNATKN